jgi:ribonuclease HII
VWIEKQLKEKKWLTATKLYNRFHFNNVVGVGHAGLNAIAGPLYVCALLLPPNHRIPNLHKVKTMAEKESKETAKLIENKAKYIHFGIISNLDIVNKGKKRASQIALRESLIGFSKFNPPSCIIIDTLELDTAVAYEGIPIFSYKGLSDSVDSVAAAALLAKRMRSKLMLRFHRAYPEYNWEQNLGYATSEHVNAIKEYGVTIVHRNLSDQMKSKLEEDL